MREQKGSRVLGRERGEWWVGDGIPGCSLHLLRRKQEKGRRVGGREVLGIKPGKL